MKYIKLFEKWGINREVEDSAKYYIQQMLKDPFKNKYDFIYYLNDTKIIICIVIDKFKNTNQQGEFRYKLNKNNETSNYVIQLERRDDISTLIHELKHFDRHIRKGIDYHILDKGNNEIQNLKVSDFVRKIFYLFNTDEYEARYHEYCHDIDKYLSENLKENPTSKDVILMINFYLESVGDKTYKVWKIDFDINILEISTKKELIKIFNKILNNKPLIPRLNFNDIKGTYKDFVKFVKHKIGMEVTNDNFDKLAKTLNIKINQNRKKFAKKFDRIYSIMVDKYVN
jgi:hypothetical protein